MKHKKRMIFIIGSLVVFLSFLFIPLNFNDNSKKKSDVLTQEAQEILTEHTAFNKNEVYAEGKKADSNIWTMYAQMLMGDKEVEKDSKATGQIKLLGQGGVSADIPYTDISKNGDELSGDKSGTQLSAFLATYSYYGYFETVSGNAIATGISNILGGLGRFVGSLIAGIAEGISSLAEGLNNLMANLFMSLNPLALIGFGNTTALNNPLSNAIVALLSNLGLNNEFFKILTSLSLLIFTVILGIKLIHLLSKVGVKKELFKPIKNWTVRILVLGICLPMMGLFLSAIIKQIQQAKEDGNLTTSIASGYIINTRLWASTQNFAPDSTLGTGKIPNADYSSDIKFVDSDYEPSRQRPLIESINTMSYASFGGTGGSVNSNAIGMALIKEWSTNETFNVNTYAGDINIAKKDSYMANVPAIKGSATTGLEHPEKLDGYIWSGSQNVTDDNRLPSGKGTEVDFSPDKKWGVDNNGTFSTQSVALLLQSEINTSGTKFYSYNLAPSGVQGMAKNMSTVKTEWRTASLVGHGALGKFGSWLSMVVESLVQSIFYLACAWALFTISLIDILKRAFKRIFEVAVFASVPASLGLLVISLALIVVAVMAMTLPSLLITIARAFSATAIGFIPSGILIDGLQSIINAVISGLFCWLVAFPSKSRPVSFIQTIMSLPLDLAKAFDKRARLMFGSGNDGLRMMDGMNMAMEKNRQGANNPYYQGMDSNNNEENNMKNVLQSALVGVGANSLAKKLGSKDNQINQEPVKSRDFVNDYKDNKSVDRLGRLINENGEFVDENGNLLPDNSNGIDENGRRIDEYGRLVDDKGQLIDSDGEIIGTETSDIVDSNNKNFEKEAYGVDTLGNKVDQYGRLVDENGNLLDTEGNRIIDGDIGVDGDGRLVDNLGRLVNEDGNLIDEDGNIVPEGEDGYSIGGSRINEDGEIVEDSAKSIISTVGEDGYSVGGSRINEDGEIVEDSAKSIISTVGEDGAYNNLEEMNNVDTSGKQERMMNASETEYETNRISGDKTAKEEINDTKKERNDRQTKKKTSSPLMKKVSKATVSTVNKFDKALEKAPKGSLASMVYEGKDKANTVVKKAKNVVKSDSDNTESKSKENVNPSKTDKLNKTKGK